MFLSGKAIESLEQLVHDHWSITEFSACTAEYVSEALKLVETAQLAILAEARNELYHCQTPNQINAMGLADTPSVLK